MEHARHGDRYVVRFEPDEVFPERFIDFLKARSIPGGTFTAIGAVKRATLAFFDVDACRYVDRRFDEQLEVLALVGNVSVHEGAPLVHAHITLGRRDYTVLGGHLEQAVVRPTLELHLQPTSDPLPRRVDPAFGLPTLRLGSDSA